MCVWGGGGGGGGVMGNGGLLREADRSQRLGCPVTGCSASHCDSGCRLFAGGPRVPAVPRASTPRPPGPGTTLHGCRPFACRCVVMGLGRTTARAAPRDPHVHTPLPNLVVGSRCPMCRCSPKLQQGWQPISAAPCSHATTGRQGLAVTCRGTRSPRSLSPGSCTVCAARCSHPFTHTHVQHSCCCWQASTRNAEGRFASAD